MGIAICRCQAKDARACWAVRNPELYLRMDKNPRCGCTCHTRPGVQVVKGTRARSVAGAE